MRRAAKIGSKASPKLARNRQAIKRKRRTRLLLFAMSFVVVIAIVFGVGYRRFHRADLKPVPALPAQAEPIGPPGIILHSSDSPATYNGVTINAAALERIHSQDHPDWATEYEGRVYHIGYHYVILPNGDIEKGRPDLCRGCHAPHFNDCIGICTIGCFDPNVKYQGWPTKPTDAQVKSVTKLCEELMTKYHIPVENVIRHYDTKRTWCPGRRYPFKKIKKDLSQFALEHPEIRPAKFESLDPRLLKRD